MISKKHAIILIKNGFGEILRVARKQEIAVDTAMPEQISRTAAKFTRKRLAVLRGAARVFARLGFHRASLADVGTELDLTAAAIYYYVSSKDEMLYQCGQVALEQLNAALKEAWDSGADGLDSLRVFFRQYAQIVCDDFGRCLVLTNADDLPAEFRDGALAGRRALDGQVREMVRRGMADGSLRTVNPHALSSMLFGSLNSLTRWWTPDGPLQPAQVADLYLDMLVQGITPVRKS